MATPGRVAIATNSMERASNVERVGVSCSYRRPEAGLRARRKKSGGEGGCRARLVTRILMHVYLQTRFKFYGRCSLDDDFSPQHEADIGVGGTTRRRNVEQDLGKG